MNLKINQKLLIVTFFAAHLNLCGMGKGSTILDVREVHPTCNAIRALDPHTKDLASYLALAQKMEQDKLTLCDCIKQITWHDTVKAARKIDPEYGKEGRRENKFKMNIICDQSVPEYLCSNVKKVFESKIEDTNYDMDLNIGVFKVDEDGYFNICYDAEKPEFFSILNVCKHANKLQSTFVLGHEKTHVERLHHIEFALLNYDIVEKLLKSNKTILPYPYLEYVKNCFKLSSFQRQAEKEADLLTLACDKDCDTYEALRDIFRLFYYDSYGNGFPREVKECLNYYRRSDPLNFDEISLGYEQRCRGILQKWSKSIKPHSHPSWWSRIKWALRIAKLKAAQARIADQRLKELKKEEEMRIERRDNWIKRFFSYWM